MAKSFDPEIINPILTGFIEDLITAKGGIPPTKSFEVAVKPIEEYEGRMRVNATDKFDVAVFLAVINFYLNKADSQANKARGAILLYLNTEVADKIFKAATFQVPYDEDDESMMALCGGLCRLVAVHLRDRLGLDGFLSLEISEPAVYKNAIPEGVAFSREQDEKQEISFYFLKHKALAIDWTMGPIPKR
ncbi:MAG: hypothetical protein KGJ09_08920 [Candidatus Omnitrophica bacterium]|nr:hypothetical protein [Candidatus Omnitrophota bacterium]MDE2215070.1 hypothetical protein [Candidatus Omnitrophota bacterium]MDE2232213.1 hypothetical protein [Candidatus Omnitrophota bacterium]